MVAKDQLLGALIEECTKRVPPKQSAYLDYFRQLLQLSQEAESDNSAIAARLWLALVQSSAVASLKTTEWHFRLDEHVLTVLEKLLSRGLISAGSTIDITRTNEEGSTEVLQTIEIMDETLRSLMLAFDPRLVSSTAQIKLIQLLLTAATNPGGAISGPSLCLALNKLAEVMLWSNAPVNQNAAKAAITQIVNGRMEREYGETHDFDQEVIFGWLCGVIRHYDCPLALSIFCLELVLSIMRSNARLFQGGELSGSIKKHLFPSLIGPLVRTNDVVFSLCTDILAEIVRSHRDSHKEVLEIVCEEYFAPPLSLDPSEGGRIPLIKGHLRPYKNKIKAIRFIKTVVFDDAEVLFFFFHNYDCEAGMSCLLEKFLGLLNVFVRIDWHNAEGPRIPNSLMTEKGLLLKLSCAEALESFMSTVLSWYHQRGEESPLSSHQDVLEYKRIQARKQSQAEGVELFNGKAVSGLEAAAKAGLIQEGCPADAARWLRFSRGINKRSVGDFLGASANEAYLDAYVKTFDFGGLSFVQSFRLFLESFWIPGEAQIIERFMEKFSTHLYSFLGEEFRSVDVLFQISYSTLMLNTDMYSSSVKEKMTREAFLKNTLGAIDEANRPTEGTLSHIYDEIAAAEVQLQSPVVEHPLPLGSRLLLPTAITDPGRLTGALLVHCSTSWAASLALIIDLFHTWPPNRPFEMPSSRFSAQEDLVGSILSSFSDLIELTCALYLGIERYFALERLLESKALKAGHVVQRVPPDSHLFESSEALSWLYDICDERGNDLGSSWTVVLRYASEWDLTTLVDKNHNLRELDLSRYDGPGILYFAAALLACPQDSVRARSFVSHYVERLFQLPSAHLERVIRISYEDRLEEVDPLFSILARGAEDDLLAPVTFALLQRVAREQMPLILSLTNEAMFGFLRAIERFAIRPTAEIGREAIDTLVLIGDMLNSKHCSGQETVPVDDEEFFLKWYHVLSGLSRVFAEQDVADLSRLAVQSLFKLLREQGRCYQEGAWRVVWRSIILPLLEEGREPETEVGAAAGQLVRLLEWSVELVSLHSQVLISPNLHDVFDNILKHLESMAKNITHHNHTEEGLRLLKVFIEENHVACFTAEHWTAITDVLLRVFESLIPPKSLGDYVEVVPPDHLNPSPSTTSLEQQKLSGSDLNLSIIFPSQQSNSRGAAVEDKRPTANEAHEIALLTRRCAMQHLFLLFLKALTVDSEAERSILGPHSRLGFGAFKTILLILLRAYEFAVSFNGNMPLRLTMVKHRLADSAESVVLNQQENGSLFILTGMLFELYTAALTLKGQVWPMLETAEVQEEVALQYLKISEVALQRYVELKLPNRLYRKVGKSWTELGLRILRQWIAINRLASEHDVSSLNQPLLVMAHTSIETQIAIALELCTSSERTSSVTMAAKEFVSATVCRLVGCQLTLLRDSLSEGDCDK